MVLLGAQLRRSRRPQAPGGVAWGRAPQRVHDGGDPVFVVRATAELWDPATETFGPAGAMGEPRTWHTATLLPDGRVLVVGGDDAPGHTLAAAELGSR